MQHPPGKPRRSREEIAREEIGHTDIAPGTKRFLAVFFLAAILLVPAVQVVCDLRAHAAGTRQSAFPGGFDAIRAVRDACRPDAPDAPREAAARPTLFGRILARNRAVQGALHAHEDGLAGESWISAVALTPVQTCLADVFGVGNEEAYAGVSGWLFYRPDIEHLWGRGFLEEPVLRARRASGGEWRHAPQPDPLPAILGLAADLRERGIALVVVPAPSKATLFPRLFAPRARTDAGPALNASYAQFTNELSHPALFLDGRLRGYPEIARDPAWRGYAEAAARLAAVRDSLVAEPPVVFDAVSALAESGEEAAALFLKGDTHWTPRGMECVAAALAGTLRGILPAAPAPASAADAPASGSPGAARSAPAALPRIAVTNVGDIAKMLQVPDSHPLRAPESVRIRPVAPAPAAAPARVLLLGDSFSNIYSQEGLGWGTDAGFAEQLSLELGEPVARIAVNAGGAHAARAELVRRAARHAAGSGPDPLDGVRVVVCQFAMRELSGGDWRLLPLPPPSAAAVAPGADDAPADGGADAAAPGRFRVSGTIAGLTRPPAPASVPYEDAVVNVHLVNLEWGDPAPEDPPDEILLYAWGMRKRTWCPVARMEPGDAWTLDVVPWETAMDDYGSYNRTDFEDFDLLMLPAYWGDPSP